MQSLTNLLENFDWLYMIKCLIIRFGLSWFRVLLKMDVIGWSLLTLPDDRDFRPDAGTEEYAVPSSWLNITRSPQNCADQPESESATYTSLSEVDRRLNFSVESLNDWERLSDSDVMRLLWIMYTVSLRFSGQFRQARFIISTANIHYSFDICIYTLGYSYKYTEVEQSFELAWKLVVGMQCWQLSFRSLGMWVWPVRFLVVSNYHSQYPSYKSEAEILNLFVTIQYKSNL